MTQSRCGMLGRPQAGTTSAKLPRQVVGVADAEIHVLADAQPRPRVRGVERRRLARRLAELETEANAIRSLIHEA